MTGIAMIGLSELESSMAEFPVMTVCEGCQRYRFCNVDPVGIDNMIVALCEECLEAQDDWEEDING